MGSFPVDEITIRYLRRTRDRLLDPGIERFTEADLEGWSMNPPQPNSPVVCRTRLKATVS
jgi:hypothetical protein